MARRGVGGLLAVDFFTLGYRISAHVSVLGKTVADILNDRLTSYLTLNDAYISRVTSPADIVDVYPEAELRKDGLLFAIVPARERLARSGRSTSYFGRQLRDAWLALPTFEIQGQFEITGLSVDWKSFLAKEITDYLPIVNCTARLTANPDVAFGGEAFLVNRAHIDLFCLKEESD